MEKPHLKELRFRLMAERVWKLHEEPTPERVDMFARCNPNIAALFDEPGIDPTMIPFVVRRWECFCTERTWTVCWEYCANCGVLMAHAETAEDACEYAFQVYSGKEFREKATIRVFKGEPAYVFKGHRAW